MGDEKNIDVGFSELRKWLRARNITIVGFQEISGIDRNVIWRLLHGQLSSVSLTLADQIAAATDNAIGHDEVRAYEKRARRFRLAMRGG